MSTQLFFGSMPNLTIPNGAADSNVLNMLKAGFDAEALTVCAPGTLDALTYTWLVSVDGGATYCTLTDLTGTAIIVPAATKAIVYNGVFTGITNLKLHASGNVAADRVFQLGKAWRA